MTNFLFALIFSQVVVNNRHECRSCCLETGSNKEHTICMSPHLFLPFRCLWTGTAGVWRISALNEAGGWKDRTTVEDMDLAVRASLKGWKFVFLGDLMVKIRAVPVWQCSNCCISLHCSWCCIAAKVN